MGLAGDPIKMTVIKVGEENFCHIFMTSIDKDDKIVHLRLEINCC